MQTKSLWVLILFFLFLDFGLSSCEARNSQSTPPPGTSKGIVTGAERLSVYLPLLKGKRVALVANHASRIGKTHLLDTLLRLKVEVRVIFSPEHGFRGVEDAGAKVKDGLDPKSGLPVYSLYGDHKKPGGEELANVDVILFDLQDVGVRFYTYLSTLHYVLQAAAEQSLPTIVLDRPNSFMNLVDGPMMQEESMSFVGLHPVPLIYGMTIGEYARMIAEEKWLETEYKVDYQVIYCQNLARESDYTLPIAPSPNLPNMQAIMLYPSLALFEGTVISVGRGTVLPFQQIGHPKLKDYYTHSFTPKATKGASNPKLKGEECYGMLLDKTAQIKSLNLQYLIEFYAHYPNKDSFFNNYFHLLVGNKVLIDQIKEGSSVAEIRASWEEDIKRFKKLRKKYLHYPSMPEVRID